MSLSYDVLISQAGNGGYKQMLALPLKQIFRSQEISAFVDEVDLRKGMDAGQVKNATVNSCKVFLALIDCHYYLQAEHCMRELRTALSRENCTVFPVFLSGLKEYPVSVEASKKVVNDKVFGIKFEDWTREEYVETVQEVLRRTGLRACDDKTFELAHVVVSVQHLLVSGKSLSLDDLMKDLETVKRVEEVKAATLALGSTSVFRRLYPIERCKVGRLDNKAVNLHHESYENLKRSLIIDGKSSSVVGVRGAGGVGKTWLAIRLGNDEDVIHHFSDGILFSTFGEEEKTSIEALQRLWIDLGGSDAEKDKLNLSNAQSFFTQLLAKREPKTLLILDDIWDERYILAFKDVVHDHPPTARAVKLLVTSRDERHMHIRTAFGEDCAIYPIQARLNDDEALQLMEAFAEKQSLGIDEEAMLRAAAVVDYHPKALSIVSTQARLSNTWKDFADNLEEDFAEVPAAESAVKDVKSAIWFTFKKRFKDHEVAEERFLRLGGFVEDAFFSKVDLQHVWGNKKIIITDRWLQSFLECSIIEGSQIEEGVYYLNGLVRQCAREENPDLTKEYDAEFTELMREIVQSRKSVVTQYMFDWFVKHAGECDEALELRDAYEAADVGKTLLDKAWSGNRILVLRVTSKSFANMRYASLELCRDAEFLQCVLDQHEEL